MYFDSWQAFWAMGKYGPFVWSAFGGGFLVMLVLQWLSCAKRHHLRRQLQQQRQQQQDQQQASTQERVL